MVSSRCLDAGVESSRELSERSGLCKATTVLSGAEERGVDGPSLVRSYFSRLQPISFLFFDPSTSHIANLVACARYSISMLHTHACTQRMPGLGSGSTRRRARGVVSKSAMPLMKSSSQQTLFACSETVLNSIIKFLKKDFILHSHDWKCLNCLTDECVSDHSERIRSMQIDKNFITQTFRIYNFIISRTVRNILTVLLMMKLYIRNVWVIKFLSICIDLILSLWSETHSSVKQFKHLNSIFQPGSFLVSDKIPA